MKRLAKHSTYRFRLSRQLAHQWLGALERIPQLHQIGNHGFSERAFDQRRREAVVADEERDVRQVLGVVASHHFGEDQIERGRTEQPQPAGGRTGDGNQVRFLIAAEENLIGFKQMRDVQTVFHQLPVGRFLRVPEITVGTKDRDL